MYLNKTKRVEVFAQCGKVQNTTNTGPAESWTVLFSYRIKHLAEHIKRNRKDHITTRSSAQLVGKRCVSFDCFYDRDIECYRAIIKASGSRK